MANIILTLPPDEQLFDGKQVTFKAPCDCSTPEGLSINGQVFTVVDSMGNAVLRSSGRFAAGALVSVLLDTVNSKAYILNAINSNESFFFQAGETVRDWANNPNGVYKKFVVASNGYPSDGAMQTEGFYELKMDFGGARRKVLFHQYGGTTVLTRELWQGTWRSDVWNHQSAGNANTVGGKYPSSFRGQETGFGYTSHNGADLNEFTYECYRFVMNAKNCPAGSPHGFLDVSVFSGGGFSPSAATPVVRQTWTDYNTGYMWTRCLQPEQDWFPDWTYAGDGAYLPLDGTVSMTGALTAKGVVQAYSAYQNIALHASDVESSGAGLFSLTHGTWLSNIDKNGKITHYGTATGNLPLDGSVNMNGALGFSVNGGGFRISPSNIQTQLVANGSATQGFRVLSIVTHDYTANDADALRFEGYDGTTNATYTVLHTGNSAKVVVSDTPLTAEGSIRVW